VAIYHCSIKIISRGKGKTAVAAAAYRSGETLTNEYDGVTHDYTRKGGIVHTEILLPDHAPREYADRAVLWNAVEKIEKAKNSQLAREIEIGLPKELTDEEHISLVREYVKGNFVAAGMCADFAIHDTGGGNPHAHIMLTMRPIEQGGEWGGKQKKEYILDPQGNKIYDPKKRQYKCKSIPATDWNERTKAEEWRAAWAEIANEYLERNGHAERIDHRSYERQGIEQIPTIHLGVAAFQMEKCGIATERGNINREIEITNRELRQLKARISKLDKWLKEEAANTEPPTLADVITGILDERERSGRYYAIGNLKAAASLLNFLTANGITDMAGLDRKVTEIHNQFDRVRANLNKVERRAKTLDEHLRQSGNYKEYRGHMAQYEKLYAQYKTLAKTKGFGAERKAQKALDAANEYYEANRPQIAMYENADRYLRDVLQERFDPKKLPPITAWTAERGKLNAEQKQLYSQYHKLKDEVKKVEQVRKGVYEIVREEQHRQQPQKSHGLDR
jgi:ATP-dependent exoDNAse (exonuclease V) alpha subunit